MTAPASNNYPVERAGRPAGRDVTTYAGLTAVAVAAAVLSFSALTGLAALAGVTTRIPLPAGAFRLAWLLPIAVDAYAVTATRVWLRSGGTERTRGYARRNSIGAIGLSVAGNATYHGLTAAGVTSLAGPGWLLVVAVSAVPPVMLGLVGHLHALLSADERPTHAPVVEPAAGPAPARLPTGDATTPAAAVQSRPATPATPAASVAPDRRSRSAGSPSAGTGPHPRKPRTGPAGNAGAEALMREHWRTERAAGRTPTGAELDRVAGTRDYGRRIRRALLLEDADQPANQAAGQSAGQPVSGAA